MCLRIMGMVAFPADAGEAAGGRSRPANMTFRPFRQDQLFLVSQSLDKWLPQEHLARFIADLVDEHLDLSGFYAGYR